MILHNIVQLHVLLANEYFFVVSIKMKIDNNAICTCNLYSVKLTDDVFLISLNFVIVNATKGMKFK